MPTVDAAALVPNSPNAVAVSRNEQLLGTLKVIKVISKYDLGLSTGHVNTEEALMVIRAQRRPGSTRSTCSTRITGDRDVDAQMKEAVRLGALIEIV
jgi:hypothetical protein